MKMIAIVLIVVLFGLQNTHSGIETKTVPRYRAESSAYTARGKDGWTYVTENRSFRFADVLGDTGNYEAELLLEETYRNERTDGIEGMRGNATIRAWTLDHAGQRKLRWAFHEAGNEGEMEDRFFRVTAWGCCDMPTVYSYYNVLTGNKLYVSNSDLLKVWVDEGGPLAWRYIAFGYAGQNELDQPPQLQYGTDESVSDRFSLVSSREYYDAPQMYVATNEKLQKSLDLRGSARSFVIILKYQDGVELRIPVENDNIRPQSVKFPRGYSLQLKGGM
ncbi:MAG TPA: hypothetical protein VN881_12570 [Candidatus Acidoferrales bacterium]|nr:hypothetical protein [Candidatus Acidoferrales bacterium]